MNFSSRYDAVEHLDAPEHDHTELAASLDQLARVNRWLGGVRVVRKHLARSLPRYGAIRLLDVGTGAGDIPAAIVRWAGRRGRGRGRGRHLRVYAVDRQVQVAQIANQRCSAGGAVQIVASDGLQLPFGDDTFDVAMSSLTLHHLENDAARAFVAELARVSRHAVIVNDLERHPINYYGARVLAATVWRGDRYIRHDGPVSVLRSFNRRELLGVGQAAGLQNARVHRHFPYRLALVGRPV